MTTLIVHPDNKEKLKALKVVMKALKISFEEKQSPYDPEFVASVLHAEQDIKDGKGVKIATEDLWK
jgi:hypothetical protein